MSRPYAMKTTLDTCPTCKGLYRYLARHRCKGTPSNTPSAAGRCDKCGVSFARLNLHRPTCKGRTYIASSGELSCVRLESVTTKHGTFLLDEPVIYAESAARPLHPDARHQRSGVGGRGAGPDAGPAPGASGPAAQAVRETPAVKVPMSLRDARLMEAPSLTPNHCAWCGATFPLSLHHVVPRGRGGHFGPLLTLCGSGTTGCHGRAEDKRLHFDHHGGGWWGIETPQATKTDNLPAQGWERLEERWNL